MSDLQQQLSALLRSADIRLTDQQKQQLTGYVEMLHKWNKAYNLTSVRQPEQMLVRHIMALLNITSCSPAKNPKVKENF